MQDNLAFVAVVLDRSSSMSAVREATIAGFNAFLDEQKQQPGEALFLLTQFADSVIPGTVDAIHDVKSLTPLTYQPYGNTALYDAIGYTIDAVGLRLASMPEEQRPSRVLIMIQTDGQENVSRRHSRSQIASMIKHQREKYNWQFAFIGALESSLVDAEALNIPVNFMTQYAPTAHGTAQVLLSASAGVSRMRGMNADQYAVSNTMDFFVGPSRNPQSPPK